MGELKKGNGAKITDRTTNQTPHRVVSTLFPDLQTIPECH